jgi:hypothetical protein
MSKVMSPKTWKDFRKEKENPTRESANCPRLRPHQLEEMQSAPQEDSQHAQEQQQPALEQELEPITVSVREPLRASDKEGGGAWTDDFSLAWRLRRWSSTACRNLASPRPTLRSSRSVLRPCAPVNPDSFPLLVAKIGQKLTGVGAHHTNDRKPGTGP